MLGRKASSVTLDQVAKRVTPLIEAKTGEATDMLAIYDVVYRTHSTYDAHPAKVLGQLIKEDGELLRVASENPWFEPVVSIGLMSIYVATLGRWIEDHLGGDVRCWISCIIEIHDTVKPLDG